MSFGSLSEPAKVALAKGAELAGTGIASGEGGMLAEEQAAVQPLFLRARLGALRLLLGQGRQSAGVPLQGRPSGQDRHRRPSAGQEGHRQDRDHARAAGGAGRDLPCPLSGMDRSLRTSAPSPTRCAAAPAASRSATSSPPSTSRRTSTPRSRSAATTSSSTDAAARPARRRASFATTFRCRRFPALARARRHLDQSGRKGRHAHHHRRAAHARRLRQGAGARRRCGRARELGHPGDRLPRHARLPHQQLPGRDRDPEAAPHRAPRRRQIGGSGWRASSRHRSS